MSTFGEKARTFIMERFGKTAQVVNVTQLNKSLYQISIYLSDPFEWTSCQRAKFMMGGAFRDYTYADWDPATNVAVLLIDAGHNGAGANGVRKLQAGDQLFYATAEAGLQQPAATKHIVCIGDASAVGQFTSVNTRKSADQQCDTLIITDNTFPETILDMHINTAKTTDEISGWLQSLSLGDTTFHVAGNNKLVVKIRRTLKDLGWKQIKVTGFWD
jgi:NADPH-dependent ferric siderophore reductase